MVSRNSKNSGFCLFELRTRRAAHGLNRFTNRKPTCCHL